MGFGHVGSVATIWNYAEADKFYNSKPAHTRCKGWQSHERCLKQRPSGNRHYRIEQHDNGEYYDIILYSTVMARFYKPDDAGHSRILYAGHSSVTSQSFMHRVLSVWSGRRLPTTDGRTVVAPIYNDNQLNDKGELFSLDITVDSEYKLIVDKSQHTPHYTHKSNATDRAFRKAIKERFASYIMLAQMRMPEFANECVPTHTAGRPFGGGDTSFNERMAVESMWSDAEHEEHWINHFFDLCQDAYTTIASKRGYEQDNFKLSHRWYTPQGFQPSPVSDLEKPVTEKDLEKAVLNRLYKILGANRKSEAVPQPQFMEDNAYPRSSITTFA